MSPSPILLLVAAVLPLLLFCGIAAGVKNDWPMMGGGPTRSNFANVSVPYSGCSTSFMLPGGPFEFCGSQVAGGAMVCTWLSIMVLLSRPALRSTRIPGSELFTLDRTLGWGKQPSRRAFPEMEHSSFLRRLLSGLLRSSPKQSPPPIVPPPSTINPLARRPFAPTRHLSSLPAISF